MVLNSAVKLTLSTRASEPKGDRYSIRCSRHFIPAQNEIKSIGKRLGSSLIFLGKITKLDYRRRFWRELIQRKTSKY